MTKPCFVIRRSLVGHSSFFSKAGAKRLVRLPSARSLFLRIHMRPRARGMAAVGSHVAFAASDHTGVARAFVVEVAAVVVVVGADVAGHLGSFTLVLVRLDDRHLHDFSART